MGKASVLRGWETLDIHYAARTSRPHFAPSQTSARIDFLRQGWQLVDKKGTHNVKIRTENITRCKFAGWQVAWLKRRSAANNIERMGKTPILLLLYDNVS